jgi:hypothetical protein
VLRLIYPLSLFWPYLPPGDLARLCFLFDLSISLSHSLSLPLSLTHTHTHTVSLSLSHTHTHTHSLALSSIGQGANGTCHLNIWTATAATAADDDEHGRLTG